MDQSRRGFLSGVSAIAVVSVVSSSGVTVAAEAVVDNVVHYPPIPGLRYIPLCAEVDRHLALIIQELPRVVAFKKAFERDIFNHGSGSKPLFEGS